MCLGHLKIEPNPQVGEHWYVKYWSAGAVAEVIIKSKSLRTIELRSVYAISDLTTSRFEFKDVQFIERTQEAP